MAASGYITEGDMNKVWDTTVNTTNFTTINVRIGELLNIKFNGDATTDVTDTKVLPFLEQFSEELLIELTLASKSIKFADTWAFIQANVTDFFSRKLWKNRDIIKEVLTILGKRIPIEVASIGGFGASNTL